MKTSTGLQVTMVDDDDEDAFLMRRALEDSGLNLNFTHIDNGLSFFQYLEDEAVKIPDVLLLDINMPGMDGYEILKRLAENEEWSKIHVAVLTTSTLDADRKKVMTNGAREFYSKPSSISEANVLVFQIKEWLTSLGVAK
jgi:CheY-like chemotaxis protein